MNAIERTAADTFAMQELCEASGTTRTQIEFWCRFGLIAPAKASTGRGDHRAFNTENILEATQAFELARAGYSTKQLQKLFTAQRARVATFAPPERLVRRFEMYVRTIRLLADAFGRGPGYDEWLKTQQRQLRRMEKDLARLGGGPRLDERFRRLLSQPERPTHALV